MVEGASLFLRDPFLPSHPSFADWCRPGRAHKDGLADRLESSTQVTAGGESQRRTAQTFRKSTCCGSPPYLCCRHGKRSARPTDASIPAVSATAQHATSRTVERTFFLRSLFRTKRVVAYMRVLRSQSSCQQYEVGREGKGCRRATRRPPRCF